MMREREREGVKEKMSELGTSEVALNGRPRNWQTIAQRPELEMNMGMRLVGLGR